MMFMNKKVVAVDFDGTICENAFPHVGAPKWNVIKKLREWHEQGHIIVIWTCRTDQTALDAVRFLNENKIPYDYFNEYPLNSWGDWTRKIFAHIYLDDRALNVADIDNFDLETETLVDTQVRDDIEFLLQYSGYILPKDMDRCQEIKERYGL
jgi:hypothetical protein